jgi:Ca2+-binding EF-hand superfamily protein
MFTSQQLKTWQQRESLMSRSKNLNRFKVLSKNKINKWHDFYHLWSRGSSGSIGSIVSDYGLDDRGSIPDRGRGFFF